MWRAIYGWDSPVRACAGRSPCCSSASLSRCPAVWRRPHLRNGGCLRPWKPSLTRCRCSCPRPENQPPSFSPCPSYPAWPFNPSRSHARRTDGRKGSPPCPQNFRRRKSRVIPLGCSTLERPSASMPSARHERPHGGVSRRQEKNDETDFDSRAEQVQRQRIIGAVSYGMDQPDPDGAGIGRTQERSRLPRKHQPGALVPPIRMPALRRPPLPAPSGAGIAANPVFLAAGGPLSFDLPGECVGSRSCPLPLQSGSSVCSDRHPFVRSGKGPSLRPDPALDPCGAAAGRSKAALSRRDRKIFCPLSLGKKYRPSLLIRAAGVTHAGPHGGTLMVRPCGLAAPPLPFPESILKSSGWMWAPAGMWAKASISPSLRSKTGEAQPIGQSPIVQISTGAKAGVPGALAGFAPPGEQSEGSPRMNGWRKIGISGIFALLFPAETLYWNHNPPTACRGLKGRTGENLSAFCFFE